MPLLHPEHHIKGVSIPLWLYTHHRPYRWTRLQWLIVQQCIHVLTKILPTLPWEPDDRTYQHGLGNLLPVTNYPFTLGTRVLGLTLTQPEYILTTNFTLPSLWTRLWRLILQQSEHMLITNLTLYFCKIHNRESPNSLNTYPLQTPLLTPMDPCQC